MSTFSERLSQIKSLNFNSFFKTAKELFKYWIVGLIVGIAALGFVMFLSENLWIPYYFLVFVVGPLWIGLMVLGYDE